MWAFTIRQVECVSKNDQVYLLFAFSFALADILSLRFPLRVVCFGSGLGGFKDLTPSAPFLKDNAIVTR